MVSKIRRYIRNVLAGIFLPSAFIVYSPFVSAKLRNIDFNVGYKQDYVIKRERSQLEDLVNKYDKSKTQPMLAAFDSITNFDGITNKIIKEFKLKDYEKEIRRKVSDMPDIEAYSDLWVLLGKMRVPGFHFNAIAFNNYNIIFLNQTVNSFSSETLKHEYTHSIGRVYCIFNVTNKNLLDLDEGLTQYFANKIFGDNDTIYYSEQKLVDVLGKISEYIERRDGINYSILAKSFFVDRSLNEFVERFDNTFGKGKFNSIFYGKDDFYDKGVKFNSLLSTKER